MKENKISLKELADLVEGTLVGDGDITVKNLDSLDAAGAEDITFLVKKTEAGRLKKTQAACAIVPQALNEELPLPVIKVKDPYLASAIIHNRLLETEWIPAGIHERAYVGDNCTISENVSIGPLVAIGNRVTVGERVTVEPGVVLGDDVVIGDDTLIKANVTVAEKCSVGNRVIIHSGTVIGSDGYGYATDSMGNHVKRPQVGKVRIDDDVEIGSNVSIDRGTLGDTWIQSGAKIDNQVQIAHNVVVGPNSLLVAQVGIAGSTTLGRNVVLGGQVGVNGHIHLDDQVMVAASSGIHNSQPKGMKLGGTPAIPIKNWAKATAVFAKLPEMYSEFRKIKKIVANLQSRLEQSDSGDRK